MCLSAEEKQILIEVSVRQEGLEERFDRHLLDEREAHKALKSSLDRLGDRIWKLVWVGMGTLISLATGLTAFIVTNL